jgi:23S rRNA (adenine-N6)-dimethyltransferase
VSAAQSRPSGRARNWSWNRLADDVARDLVERSGVGRHHLVLDIGAGDGAITAHLEASGARVVAFELHEERARSLRTQFPSDRVRVVCADVRDLRLPTRPFRVVANPPFRGVNAVLVRLTHHGSRLERADLVLPRSVAADWTSRVRRTRWEVAEVRPLPRWACTPRPRIDLVHTTIVARSR